MSIIPKWQLKTPIEAVIFDCDGTLSAIEGIDELAKYSKAHDEVQRLTADAMGKSGLNPELYKKRLDLICPKKEHVLALGKKYFEHRVPDISEVISIFTRLNKTVYIISAGLYPAVAHFGELLNIPTKNIFAVDISFDQQGNFTDYDNQSPLTQNQGKKIIVNQLKKIHQEIIYVGDGLNDYVTYELVRRFIGYGGIFCRENIAQLCEYYIRDASMSALLPLVLTQHEYEQLQAKEKILYKAGLASILHCL